MSDLLKIANEIKSDEGYQGYLYFHPKRGFCVIIRLLKSVGSQITINSDHALEVVWNERKINPSEYSKIISEYYSISLSKIDQLHFESCYMNRTETYSYLTSLIDLREQH
jgi:hypothetical protein